MEKNNGISDSRYKSRFFKKLAAWMGKHGAVLTAVVLIAISAILGCAEATIIYAEKGMRKRMPGALRKYLRVSRTALPGVRRTRLAFYYREKLRKEEKRLERLFFLRENISKLA